MQLDLDKIGGSNSVKLLHQMNEIENVPIPQLRQIQQQLKMDIDRLEKVSNGMDKERDCRIL